VSVSIVDLKVRRELLKKKRKTSKQKPVEQRYVRPSTDRLPIKTLIALSGWAKECRTLMPGSLISISPSGCHFMLSIIHSYGKSVIPITDRDAAMAATLAVREKVRDHRRACYNLKGGESPPAYKQCCIPPCTPGTSPKSESL